MSLIYKNPFSHCRGLLGKEYLIGRVDVLQDIAAWVQRERNLSLYGMLHVGKSCVLHTAIMEQKEILHRENILPIISNLPSMIEANQKPEQFFRILVEQTMEELEELNMVSDRIERSASKALQKDLSWTSSVGSIQRFFQRVHEADIRIIFVLEKFDHITTIFKKNIAPFSVLQDLSLKPACRVRFITESLHPLKEIVPNDPTISTFNKLFDHYCLSLFNEQDMSIYFERLASVSTDSHSFPLTTDLQLQIDNYCGGHPYLLIELGYELAELFLLTGQVDIERTFHKLEANFTGYIVELKSTLQSEQIDTLVQVMNDTKNIPVQDDLDILLKYGLIRPDLTASLSTAEPAYIAFLSHFQNHWQAGWSKSLEDLLSWSQTMHPESLEWERYKIIKQVGTTKHSQVAKAFDTRLSRFVAIKRLYLDPTRSKKAIKEYQRALKREAEILGSLEHKNIGRINDLENDPPSLIMQWIEGESLADVLKRETRLPLARVIRLGMTLAQTLWYIHTKEQQVIHRDIKPGNIILRDDGEPILIDFDIARAASQVETAFPYDEQGKLPSLGGTEYYAAPEQFTNPKSVTDRTDIYSLGVVLYEALTGLGPDNNQVSSSQWEYPEASPLPTLFWKILRTTLSEDPQARPDAQQLSEQLECSLQELGE